MKKKEHKIWPWNPAYMWCPEDGKWHRFGCKCVREKPELVPDSIRDWYEKNWRSGQ